MTLQHIGPDNPAGPCVRCGNPSVFRDDTTGQFHHVGPLCGAPPATQTPAGPRPGRPAELPKQLEPYATRTRDLVHAAAAELGGDLERVFKRAIPIVMELFLDLRAGGRYPVIHHPPYPRDIMDKSGRKAHQVWLARPKWTNPEPPRGPVTRLDVPGAYLNAFTTWLPVQALRHDTSGHYDPRQAGVYLITPPAWEIGDLPSPLGHREEPGPMWVATPTLRNLLRAHAKYGLCGPTQIHEAWTAPATEEMLLSLKAVLGHLRSHARADGDQLMADMIKKMYSKFYSTIGQSNDNRYTRRPEWGFAIEAQAHWNLWERAYKAREAGLQVIKVGGTDEIHLVGDWRLTWTEGNEFPQMKIKDS